MRHKFKNNKVNYKKKIINLYDYFYTIVSFYLYIYIRTTLNILYTYI